MLLLLVACRSADRQAEVATAGVYLGNLIELRVGEFTDVSLSHSSHLVAVWHFGRFGSDGFETPMGSERRIRVHEFGGQQRFVAQSDVIFVQRMVFGPDDTLWVEMDGDHSLFKAESPSWQLRSLDTTGTLVRSLEGCAAVEREGRLRLLHLGDGSTIAEVSPPEVEYEFETASNARFAWIATRTEIRIVDLSAGGQVTHTVAVTPEPYDDPADVFDISPDGKSIAYYTGFGVSDAIQVVGTSGTRTTVSSPDYIWDAVFTSVSELLVITQGSIFALNIDTQECRQVSLPEDASSKNTFGRIHLVGDRFVVSTDSGEMAIGSLSEALKCMKPSRQLRISRIE